MLKTYRDFERLRTDAMCIGLFFTQIGDNLRLSPSINFAEFSNDATGFIIVPTGEATTYTAVHLTATKSTERKLRK